MFTAVFSIRDFYVLFALSIINSNFIRNGKLFNFKLNAFLSFRILFLFRTDVSARPDTREKTVKRNTSHAHRPSAKTAAHADEPASFHTNANVHQVRNVSHLFSSIFHRYLIRDT